MKIKAIKVISILMLVITPFLITFQQTLAQDTQPMYVHLSWQNDTTTTMIVSWRTKAETSAIVQYGADENYGNEETGATGQWHHVELTGLTPDTIYHYRVGDGETWSNDFTFKTGTTGNHLRFVAWGDSRHNREERKEVVNAANSLEHDLSIFTGDFVDDGVQSYQWWDWFTDFSPYLKHIPFMGVLGSHDDNHSNYYDAFALPGKEEYYSFNYGPVHFIGLHSEISYWGGTYNKTIEWLLEDLETHNDYKWKIVAQHLPCYASAAQYHSGWFDEMLTLFVPIFEEYNVTMVFSGHNHLYERLHKNNITYIITGGGGAPLYDVVEAYFIEESAYTESAYHAVLVEVFEKQIDIRAFKRDLSIMDQYTLNLENKPDLRCNNLPSTTKITKGEDNEIIITIKNIGEEDITEATVAKVEISNGETWNIDVPSLDVYESVDFTYDWKAPGKELYTWTITTDINDQIDEVEEYNLLKFYLDATEPEGTAFFVHGIWGVLASLSTLFLVTVILKKRK
ncbi:MAG: fibronectin type III domain-containing protein [Candidatus Heimdallarchaeota archaeon]|nr:fibronectin type III domain-containing protein [Candidatus Heimdallarchaeota archaeon]MCK4770983.1 fibronectin type III domain-containing protein [Candidatus Heimdallarchaeota archaeon]